MQVPGPSTFSLGLFAMERTLEKSQESAEALYQEACQNLLNSTKAVWDHQSFSLKKKKITDLELEKPMLLALHPNSILCDF